MIDLFTSPVENRSRPRTACRFDHVTCAKIAILGAHRVVVNQGQGFVYDEFDDMFAETTRGGMLFHRPSPLYFSDASEVYVSFSSSDALLTSEDEAGDRSPEEIAMLNAMLPDNDTLLIWASEMRPPEAWHHAEMACPF